MPGDWARMGRVRCRCEFSRKGRFMTKAAALTASAGRTRSIAFVALTIAIMAVSAWITVPFGPVPFTLQTFAIMFAILVLEPKQSIAAVAGYLILGGFGAPVFSGMRGGLGVLVGPTGGFIWGFLIGAVLAAGLLHLLRSRGIDNFAGSIAAGVVFMVVVHVCGCAQFMAVAHTDLAGALAVTVAPFVIIDIAKLAAATVVARSVARVVRR